MVEHIGIVLNSISVICLGIALKKVQDRINNNQQQLEREKEKREEQNKKINTLCSTVEAIKDDLKNTRLEITGAARTEMKLCEFEKMYGRWITFGNGIELPEDFVDYAAKIGLKVIASELPKEKRTHEIIEYIVERMLNELNKREMLL